MANYIEYGGKRFPMEGMSLDQAKTVMARYFPELADPAVRTNKIGDDTVYTLTKRAGRKGVGAAGSGTGDEGESEFDLLVRRLQALRVVEVAPESVIAYCCGQTDDIPLQAGQFNDLIAGLQAEAGAVERIGDALLGLPPAARADEPVKGSLL